MSQMTQNVIANYVGQVWSGVMALAFIPLYVRYLGVEAYGLIGLFGVLQACFSLLDFGMIPALSREMARFTAGAHTSRSIGDLLRTLEVVCFIMAALMAVAVWLASGYLANHWLRSEHLGPGVVAEALGVMGLVVALRFCEGIYRGSLLGLQRQVLYNSAQAALATLRHLGAAGVLVWISPSVHAFFLWQAAVSLLTVVAFGLGVHRTLPRPDPPPRFSREALVGVWRFASGVMGITLLGVLLTQIDKVLLSRLLSLQTFGYYTLAATIAGTLYMIIIPITQAAYPRMVELSAHQDETALVSVYHRSAQLVSAVTAPAVALLALFSGAAVFAWSGDADLARHAAPILTPLILGTFLNGLMWMPYQLQLANGWTSLTLKVNTVAVIVLVPVIIWTVPRYGAAGAAWVWVALNAGYVIVAVNLMHRRLLRHEKWRWYRTDIGWPTLAALTVAIVASAYQPAEYQNRIFWLAFLLACGALGFFASALAASQLRSRMSAVVTRCLHWR